MSNLSSSGAVNKGSPKKPVSPARNAIGLVALIAVVVWCWFEYSAKSGYNAAVTALGARTEDETKGLMPVKEAEGLLGKSPDGPGVDFNDSFTTFLKKTYTWRGVLKTYTLTAFYTKERDPCLHHFVTEGAKLDPDELSHDVDPGTINVQAQVPARGPATGATKAEGQTPPGDPTKVANKAQAKDTAQGAAKPPTEDPTKAPAAVPAKVPAAGSADVPAKESVPEKAAPAPK